MKNHAKFKVLLNTPVLHCALLFDGKNILEYDYVNLVENSRISLADLNETKLAVNAVYISKYELYMIIFEGWKLHIFRRNM